MGLTTLVRPQSLLCAPALGLVAAIWAPRVERMRRGVTSGAIAVVAALVVVAPWTLRNCRVMDGCALVSTNGGWNLAIGASPRATGRFETLRAADGCPVVTGQVHQDRCWRNEGLRWIAEDPKRWLSLVPKKLGYTFDHESFPAGYLGEADPARWPEPRRAATRAILTGTHRLLLVVAALAFVQAPRPRRTEGPRRWLRALEGSVALAVVGLLALHAFFADDHPFWTVAVAIPVLAAVQYAGFSARPEASVRAYLAFLVAALCVTCAVFFGEDRYHVVVTPALCILAACAFQSPDARAVAGSLPPPSSRREPA